MKPQKRSLSTETDGAGGKKKSKESAPQQSGAASAATGAAWCSDCWALAQDGCRGAHQLVDVPTAHKDAVAEMAAAVLKLDQAEARLQAVTKAVLSAAPVLLVDVPEVDDNSCWHVEGGDGIRITLASTVPLTAEDIDAVCGALEGLELEYDRENGGGLPHGCLDVCDLKGVMEKLPDLATGQKCEEGDILIDADGVLTVAKKGAKSGAGAKLLGRVDEEGVDCLSGSTNCEDDPYCDNCGVPDEGTSFENVRLAE